MNSRLCWFAETFEQDQDEQPVLVETIFEN
jgi:hypothetical protein